MGAFAPQGKGWRALTERLDLAAQRWRCGGASALLQGGAAFGRRAFACIWQWVRV